MNMNKALSLPCLLVSLSRLNLKFSNVPHLPHGGGGGNFKGPNLYIQGHWLYLVHT